MADGTWLCSGVALLPPPPHGHLTTAGSRRGQVLSPRMKAQTSHGQFPAIKVLSARCFSQGTGRSDFINYITPQTS